MSLGAGSNFMEWPLMKNYFLSSSRKGFRAKPLKLLKVKAPVRFHFIISGFYKSSHAMDIGCNCCPESLKLFNKRCKNYMKTNDEVF